MIGALALIVDRLQVKRLDIPSGEFRKPLIAWKTDPPIVPIVKAPPQSSTILKGLQDNKNPSVDCNRT